MRKETIHNEEMKDESKNLGLSTAGGHRFDAAHLDRPALEKGLAGAAHCGVANAVNHPCQFLRSSTMRFSTRLGQNPRRPISRIQRKGSGHRRRAEKQE